MVIKMKKRTWMFGLVLLLAMEVPAAVKAEEANKTVSLTEENTIVYTDGDADIDNAFSGMAPGDTRTVTIRVQNDSEHAASFFISQETLNSLEEKGNASGGAYAYQLKVGNANDERATTLLSTIAGGYDTSLNADTRGLKGITELENYQYFAELGEGEYTNVYLTLTIDGEGFDSTDIVNYQNASGELALQFRAYYDDKGPVVVKETQTIEGKPTVVTQIVRHVVSRVGSVKTGDPSSIIGLSVLLLMGVACIVYAFKPKKEDGRS